MGCWIRLQMRRGARGKKKGARGEGRGARGEGRGARRKRLRKRRPAESRSQAKKLKSKSACPPFTFFVSLSPQSMPKHSPFTALCGQLARLNRPQRADLHIHTTASDGEFTPSQVVALARQAGLLAA